VQFPSFWSTVFNIIRVSLPNAPNVQMAVLKSPRNSRNKTRWAKQYALNSTKSHHVIEERKHPRVVHRLQVLLRNSAHRLNRENARKDSLLDQSTVIPNCPNPIPSIPSLVNKKHALEDLDSASTYPLLFRQHLNSGLSRRKLFILINSKNFL